MTDNFQDLKVMVIDDSKTIRRTAETLLKKAGCEVITATDGFDALDGFFISSGGSDARTCRQNAGFRI